MKDLLLLLCRYPYDKNTRVTLSNLVRGVENWNTLLELINAHGIIALAAYTIRMAGLENEIPETSLEFLENGYRQSVIRNIWIKEQWKIVSDILDRENIKHILLKGMALEHSLYGSKGLRQMSDTDILIKPDEAVKAWYLLQREGYTMNDPKSPLFRKFIFDLGQHLPALYKSGYALEIHTHIPGYDSETDLNYNKLFNESIIIRIDTKNAYILPPEIHLKYLIHHFQRHASSGECQLRLFTDIRILGENKRIEFPDQFIFKPFQGDDLSFRKAAYRSTINSLNKKNRILFILGDMFPSFKWMKKRYKCNLIRSLIYYPQRVGKILWLI
jgi:hypothetical protein